MKWKEEPADFRVLERLREGYLRGRGPWRVYRVTKRKATSLEAAAALAELAGVTAGDVELAGLKDRQGVTTQFMSIRGGRPVSLRTPELTIEVAGSAVGPLTPEESLGNAFRIRLRRLAPEELARIQSRLALVRAQGVPNYFDEQRFGNLRHGQGWIARELMLGRTESALRVLLCAESPRDDPRQSHFKRAVASSWGDWSACRDAAGRFGAHHSVFEHLRRAPADFAGAFGRVASRLRLIHLYAFQSHVWNRAVARHLAELSGRAGAGVWHGLEGPLVFPERALALDPSMHGSFRLPGAGLEDVAHPAQLELLEDVLAGLGLVPDQFRIEGVPGFALKGEDRALFVQPAALRTRVPERAGAAPGRASALLSFELPRGAYATLVVRALLVRHVPGPLDLERLAQRSASARKRREGEEQRRRADGGGARPVERPRRTPRKPPSERGERGRRG